MAVIKLLTGTTEDYEETKTTLILDDREIAVEIVSEAETGKKYYNIRQGDGKSKFFDLPIIVNNKRFEEINENIAGYCDKIESFSTTMTQSSTAATEAAQKAEQAAKSANAIVSQVENLEKGLNSIVDKVTSTEYVIGIESGVVYLESQDEE